MQTTTTLLNQWSQNRVSLFTAGEFAEGVDERQIQAEDDQPGGREEDLEDCPRAVLREGFQVR